MMSKKRVIPSPQLPAPRPRLARFVAVLCALMATTALVTGCGLRLESSVPQPLVPDSNELARQAMVNDVVLIQKDITAALKNEQFTEPQLATLHKLAERNANYERLLGGIYRSGLPQEVPEDLPDLPLTPIEPMYGSQEVIDRLLASTGRIRTTLPIATDPELARLFGSMALGNLLLAQELAKASDLEFVIPEFLAEEVPETVLALIPEQSIATLIHNEDATGYGFEVIAAMREPDRRSVALEQSRLHRQTSQFWAQVAGLAQTSQDPRRVAYTLPFELTADDAVAPEQELVALAQEMETNLATNYVDLIALATPENRVYFFDSAIRTALIGVDWGVANSALPFFSDAEEFLLSHTENME